MFSKNKTDWSLLAKSMAGETNEKENAGYYANGSTTVLKIGHCITN